MKGYIKSIIFIFILVILIILPPLLRMLLPREENIIGEQELLCTLKTENYQIIYQTIYKNSKVDHIQIKYSALASSNGVDLYSSSFANQINYFCDLKNSTYRYINSDIVITLNYNVYQLNSHDQTIKNMYQSYSSLKKYYEKIGYQCK